ncbi:MAG TPA: hypothetical protein ENK31_06385, partial [Nannocystis exedens]|nr:hypothetical protein [Nannocystis exedens]
MRSAGGTISLLPLLGTLLAPSAAAKSPSSPEVETAERARPSTTTTIRGLLRRAGDRAPLAGVTVLIYPAPAGSRLGVHLDPKPATADPPWIRRGSTDTRGFFEIELELELELEYLAAGQLAIEVLVPDYHRSRWIIDADSHRDSPPRTLKLFLRPRDRSIYRTTVHSQSHSPQLAEPAPVERKLAREEIETLPGTQGDALRAIQTLPGVARAPFGVGLLVLRGASPRQSLVYVGDHPVPFAFHLSGLSSVLPSTAIDDLQFSPSNFAPAYGNATGGMIQIRPRTGRRDALHGSVSLDLGGISGQTEGPLGRGSFLVAARRGHLDLPLRVVGALNPKSAIAYPNYYDYQAFYDRRLGRGRQLHIGFIGAGDRLAYKDLNEEGVRVTFFEPRLSFHRLDMSYRAALGATSILITPALRFDTNRVVTDPARNFYIE